MKDSFVLYTKINEMVRELEDADKGRLFQALLDYAESEAVPDVGGVVRIAFMAIKADIDRNNERYEAVKSARAEAGKKGAEKRWSDSKAKTKMASDSNATGAMANDSKDGLMNCTELDCTVTNKKTKGGIPAVLEETPEDMREAVAAFVDHRKKLKKPLTEHSLKLNIQRALKLAGGDPKRAAEYIEYSIMHGWQGIYEPHERQKPQDALQDAWRAIEKERRELGS